MKFQLSSFRRSWFHWYGNSNKMTRGALIVFEGCDRSGKTTQCKKLVDALNSTQIPTSYMSFPDRTTAVGNLINNYLQKREELPDKVIHVLFSANRWELEPKIKTLLYQGTTVVVDRYAYSGVAFSASKKNMDIDWCKLSDTGLPSPDIVFFLKLHQEACGRRAGFGEERYENKEFQERVASNFDKLTTSNWKVIDADKDVDALHSELYAYSVDVVDHAKHKKLEYLW